MNTTLTTAVHFARSALLAVLLGVSAGAASAQDMKPLANLLADAAAPYGPVRCAGLYQSMMEWAGMDRMGKETWDTMNTNRESLILLSAYISQDTSGGTIEHQVELALRDVRNVADLYLARMEANYASIGQAFGKDDVINSDLALCKTIAETLK